jgi:hypothetical protein
MKAVLLLISESPNQSRVIFKKTLKSKDLSLLPENNKKALDKLHKLEDKYPQLSMSNEEQKVKKIMLNDDLNDD